MKFRDEIDKLIIWNIMIFLFFKYLLYFQDGVLFLLFSLFIHLLEEYTQSLVGVLYKYIYFSLFIHLLEEYIQFLVGVLYKYVYIFNSVCSFTSWRSTLSLWLESFINIYIFQSVHPPLGGVHSVFGWSPL